MRLKNSFLVGVVITLLLAVLVIPLAQAAPLSAAEYNFKVINNAFRDIKVKLTSLTDSSVYEFVVKRGGEMKEAVPADKYRVEYDVCNYTREYDVDMTTGGTTLTLYPCAHQPTKMQVKNHLGKKVNLELFGYKDYEMQIKKGKNKVELFSGLYTYTYEACPGRVVSGEVKVLKNGTTQLVLHSCTWFDDPARIYGQPNPVKFRIINHATFPFYLTLIGPENYLLQVEYGINRYQLVAGVYQYSYYLDYTLHTGTLVVTKNGLGVLVLSPTYVYGFVEEDGLE